MSTRGTRAYPRRCGENVAVVADTSTRLGLPPQVRGEPGAGDVPCCRFRLTPAGAGRTIF